MHSAHNIVQGWCHVKVLRLAPVRCFLLARKWYSEVHSVVVLGKETHPFQDKA